MENGHSRDCPCSIVIDVTAFSELFMSFNVESDKEIATEISMATSFCTKVRAGFSTNILCNRQWLRFCTHRSWSLEQLTAWHFAAIAANLKKAAEDVSLSY